MRDKNSRDAKHAEIAHVIKAAKKRMFRRSREGASLRSAADAFCVDVAVEFKKLVEGSDTDAEQPAETSGESAASSPFTFAAPSEQGPPVASMEQVKEWARIICPYGAESGQQHKLPALLLLLSEISIATAAKDWIALDLIVSYARLAAYGESDQAIEAERALTAKWRASAGLAPEVAYQ